MYTAVTVTAVNSRGSQNGRHKVYTQRRAKYPAHETQRGPRSSNNKVERLVLFVSYANNRERQHSFILNEWTI